jgi:heterotetrameric sarcosine oxidase gamma subunit
VSAPEAAAVGAQPIGARLAECAADIVELAALRNGAARLGELAAAHAAPLPPRGRLALTASALILSVRPERWLLLSAPAAPGSAAWFWHSACAGCGTAVDLTSALTALQLSGPAAREVLKRGCRLDLDPHFFPAGTAAATQMAQVPVVLAALPGAVLLLTPSTTARHFREWLTAAAKPFGLGPRASVNVALLSGEEIP